MTIQNITKLIFANIEACLLVASPYKVCGMLSLLRSVFL